MELREDVLKAGRINNVFLRTICLPDVESSPGSSCITSGINRKSKIINAVPLNLFNHTFCNEHSVYANFATTLNENQLCAGIPSNNNSIISFNGEYEEDFGGPLICLDKTNKKPTFTGIASSNSLSTKNGQPGLIESILILSISTVISPNQTRHFHKYLQKQRMDSKCNSNLVRMD